MLYWALSNNNRTFTPEGGYTDLSGSQIWLFPQWISGEDLTPTGDISVASECLGMCLEIFEVLPSDPFVKVRFDPAV